MATLDDARREWTYQRRDLEEYDSTLEEQNVEISMRAATASETEGNRWGEYVMTRSNTPQLVSDSPAEQSDNLDTSRDNDAPTFMELNVASEDGCIALTSE